MRCTLSLLLLFAIAASAAADSLRLLDDNTEAAQARVDIIQQAQNEVDAMYFLARNDRITLAALTLLRDARRRGVPTVRLIVDANFNRIPKAVLAHLSEEGVEVRVYHPMKLRHPSWLFRRMHEKVVVVDAKRYITGGRNLAESYFGLAPKNYVDRDIYVEGSSAVEADRHFDELWASRHVAELHVRISRREIARAAATLDAMRESMRRGEFLNLDTNTNWSSGAREVACVRFLHDPVEKHEGPRVARHLAEVIESARSSIVIESPYVVPSRRMTELLERKRREGVRIVIVTNSFRSIDGAFPYAAYLKHRRRLVRAGVELHEYKGPDTLHAKTIVVDERTVLVGSYNLDPRSQNLNTEVMCLGDDEEIARELLDIVQMHIDNAWTVHRGAHARRASSRIAALRLWCARMLMLPVVENQL